MSRREVASLRWGSHRHEYGLGRHVARETLLRDQEVIEFRDPVLNEYHTEIKDEIKTYVLTDVVLFPAGFLTAEGVVIRESLRLQNHPPMAFRLRHCEVLDAERLGHASQRKLLPLHAGGRATNSLGPKGDWQHLFSRH